MATEVTCIVDTNGTAGVDCDYTSLNEALVGEAGGSPVVVTSADLVTNDEQLTIECRASSGSADTALADVDGFTTSATCFVKVYTTGSHRHAGEWDGSLYRIDRSASSDQWENACIQISDPHVRIDGLQLRARSSAVHTNGALNFDAEVTNCILVGHNTNESYKKGVGIDTPGSSSVIKVQNNIIYDFGGTTGSYSAGVLHVGDVSGSNTIIYNNTVVNCAKGYYRDVSSDINCSNNIAQDCVDGFYTEWQWASGSSSADYNLSDLASDAPGSNSVNSSTLTFVDAANDDYHLASGDTDAIGAGIGPSWDGNVPTTDIDGDTRSGTTTDIGADLYVAASTGSFLITRATHQHTYLRM